MSRSSKKRPISGWTKAESDKPYKQLHHGQERAAERAALCEAKKIADDDGNLGVPQVVYDPWLAPKDGKQWLAQSERLTSEDIKRLKRK